MTAIRRVALLIETSSSWGQGILEGIAEHAARSGDLWQFFIEPRGKYERLLLPDGWEGDGIIARVTHQGLADQIVASGLPAINVSWYQFSDGTIATCTANPHQAGELAAEHFLDRGFRQFAYCGSPRRPNYVDRFGRAFTECLRRRGYGCVWYANEVADDGTAWRDQLNRMGRWLASLPHPTALLTFDAITGRQVTEACRAFDIAVPEEIAVLGGEHDELFSRLSQPPLSSIHQGAQTVGREAAALLERMIAGEPRPTEPLLTPVDRVITRQSTDTLAIADPCVAAALRFIRTNSHRPIQVSDLLEVVPVSRRVLEQRFQALLGRPPAAEIRRMRIVNARRRLAETDDPVARVAVSCGFESAEVMARVFRRELNITPSEYRRQATVTSELPRPTAPPPVP